MIFCGFVYRTPIPVQPMKAAGAIATTQAAQTLVLTPAMVYGASLATGLVWLVLGSAGTARYVAHLVARPIVLGIILDLGFAFMIEGAKMMSLNWWVGGGALLALALLLTNRIIPAMFLLLLFGAACGILSDPTLLVALREVQVEPRLPTFALNGISFNDFFIGMVFLALPQVPLTLGNAIIAITEENNRLFPHRLVNESKIATSTGLMNLLSASLGGVPCVTEQAASPDTSSLVHAPPPHSHPRSGASRDRYLLQQFCRNQIRSSPSERSRIRGYGRG